MMGPTPVCFKCKHLIEDDKPGFRCDAFPKGIPQVMLKGDKHDKPISGDNGILFEPKGKQ